MWKTISFPGLRKQIFNGTWWDEETDDYVLETGIGVREYQVSLGNSINEYFKATISSQPHPFMKSI